MHPPTEPTLVTDGGHPTINRTAVADSVVTRSIEGKDEETEMIRVPISSTRPDRENDEFSKEALEEIADQIKVDNPMVFDNHGLAGNWMEAIPYDSRETIGAQMDAELESAEDGEWDLYALVNPDGTHPEGERMLKQVRDEGQPLKFSVGFKVVNADEKTDDSGNEIGRIFTSADLMETSRVGIPANPDASVTQSVTAKGGMGGLPGFANHPMVQMMQSMQGESETEVVSKSASPDAGKGACDTDSDCPEGEVCVDGECVPEEDVDPDPDDEESASIQALAEEVSKLRDEVTSLKEDAECSVDTDCPEGEVCIEGECVPEDDVDDEESSADSEAIEQLRAEIQELRDGGLKRGSPETSDTDMETRDVPEDSNAEGSDEGTSTESKDEADASGGHKTTSDIINT